MNERKLIKDITDKLNKEKLEAIVLMGSYSRGEDKQYSDIDIVCISKDDTSLLHSKIQIISGKYVVINYITKGELESCFTDPVKATEYIMGIRFGQIVYDPNTYFHNLQIRARNFEWTSDLQQKANEICGEILVGWLEEVHKALQGVISNDIGRMLNGIFGLTYGLFQILRIKNGILLTSDNSFYQLIIDFYQECNPKLVRLSEKAFGIVPTETIQEKIIAGLQLFNLVANYITKDCGEQDKQTIHFVQEEISQELKKILPK